MIINFSVKNFRSIKDEVNIVFNASSDKEHLDFITSTKYCDILNATVIYGLNASGKSNLINAIQVMIWSIYWTAKDNNFLKNCIIPFGFNETTLTSPSEFRVNFIHENIRYEYGFSADSKQIYTEFLYTYPKNRTQLLYTREWVNNQYIYKFGTNYKGDKKNFEHITKSTSLFLSTALSFDNQETAQNIHKWFTKCSVENMHLFRDADYNIQHTINCLENKTVTTTEIIKFLNEADISIIDFEIKKEHDTEQANNIKSQQIEIITKHKVNNNVYELDFGNESSGTKQIFNFAARIILTLKTGGVLIIDELNNFLHPLLVKHIVSLFSNKKANPKNAQLIFTTHETSIMTTEFLRRDQIWFCDKSTEQATILYSAQEFSLRKTDNLEKAYLAGRFGAIPILMS